VEGFRGFDDVVLEYLDASGKTSHICVQLKRKGTQIIAAKEPLDESSDFILIRHYESYVQIRTMFNKAEQNDKTKVNIDDCLFIIYTNTDVKKRLKSDNSTESDQEHLLNTGGNVLKFSEETHKYIYKHMTEQRRYRNFSSPYRIMYDQANEKRMDNYIISLTEKQTNCPDYKRELACQHSCDLIKDLWQMDWSHYLGTNNLLNDPLQIPL
jgi:hypothetical protein